MTTRADGDDRDLDRVTGLSLYLYGGSERHLAVVEGRTVPRLENEVVVDRTERSGPFEGDARDTGFEVDRVDLDDGACFGASIVSRSANLPDDARISTNSRRFRKTLL